MWSGLFGTAACQESKPLAIEDVSEKIQPIGLTQSLVAGRTIAAAAIQPGGKQYAFNLIVKLNCYSGNFYQIGICCHEFIAIYVIIVHKQLSLSDNYFHLLFLTSNLKLNVILLNALFTKLNYH